MIDIDERSIGSNPFKNSQPQKMKSLLMILLWYFRLLISYNDLLAIYNHYLIGYINKLIRQTPFKEWLTLGGMTIDKWFWQFNKHVWVLLYLDSLNFSIEYNRFISLLVIYFDFNSIFLSLSTCFLYQTFL